MGRFSTGPFLHILVASYLLVGLPEVAESRGGLFCYFCAVFSKRTLLTKSVVWKGPRQTLSIPPAAAEGLQVHFNMGASTMPRRQPRVSQNPCSEDASKSHPSQLKKARRVLGGLTDGFIGRFCSGLLGLAGGFRRGRAPADFCFRLADFLADFYFATCDQKNPPQKSITSMAVFWQIFHRRLNPRLAVSKFQVQHWNSLKLEPGLSAHFFCHV